MDSVMCVGAALVVEVVVGMVCWICSLCVLFIGGGWMCMDVYGFLCLKWWRDVETDVRVNI